MIKNICLFSGGYPTNDNPEYTFIQPVAHCFADLGINCSVIVPQSLTGAIARGRKLRPLKWVDYTEKGNKVYIFQPKTITLAEVGKGFSRLSNIISSKLVVKRYNLNPDIVYGHFWHNAVLGAKVFPGIPTIVATGEDKIWVEKKWNRRQIEEALNQVRGIIAVSTHCKNDSIKNKLCRVGIPLIILPNGYDPKTFYNFDKNEARKVIGLESKAFVGVFVGSFCERKGSQRVLDAVEQIPDCKMIFIGKGNLRESDKIIFKGELPHKEIVKYLNAADFFVLPTKSDGCCNAIIEAMACGLPIISSDRDFNDEILTSENSIRINPDNIQEIRDAIVTLKENKEKRISMAEASLKISQKLTITERTEKIISFIDDCELD